MVRTVLAIDPGNVQSGFVLWDGRRVITAAVEPNDIVRDWVSRLAHQPMGSVRVDALAIGLEKPNTGVAVGRMLECWARYRNVRTVYLLTNEKVKRQLCGTADATDAELFRTVNNRVGRKGTKNGFALALALHVADVGHGRQTYVSEDCTAVSV